MEPLCILRQLFKIVRRPELAEVQVSSKALSRFLVCWFGAMILLGLAPGQTPLGSTAPPPSGPSAPSAPAKPTFHAESRLVVVDVVVTRHGRPVTGLSKTDFTRSPGFR